MSEQSPQRIACPADPDEIRAEMARLRQGGALSTQGPLETFIAPADAIPALLHEIGRLREVTFREVGEGSGKALDLDEFDHRYLHLFVWDREAEEVAGAYRVGRTDLLLAEYGPRGLYCSTLFEFEQAFLDHLTPGLELGRSFVAGTYQRSLGPLMALWKGIGRFVARYPHYTKLFGPVSISQDYTTISKNLIVRFLREEKRDAILADFVHPSNPYHEEVALEDISARLESIEQVSARVAETEPDGKGVPVLLRQYLKLNATLLAFNVDPQFSNCLDALLMVDLRSAPAAILKRYMGSADYDRFVREGALR